MVSAPAPILVTAALDEGAFAWFDDLRRTYFPPERNVVPAHLTLFHALPGEEEALIDETLKAVARSTAPMPLSVRGPWSLGRGVAYRLASPSLEVLRSGLAEAFAPHLTRQDAAPWRPHITVQNKVEPEVAKQLLQELQHDFEPFDVVAEGLLVWRYLGGPWELLARLPFEG